MHSSPAMCIASCCVSVCFHGIALWHDCDALSLVWACGGISVSNDSHRAKWQSECACMIVTEGLNGRAESSVRAIVTGLNGRAESSVCA